MSASRSLIQDDLPDWGRYLALAAGSRSCSASEVAVQARAGQHDDLTRCVIEVCGAFDLLRDALSQVAAILVLAAAGSVDAVAHPMLAIAEESTREAREELAVLRVPPAAAHGIRHVVSSERSLRAALATLAATRDRMGALPEEVALSEAHALLLQSQRELKFAAAALPGLEVVSTSEACPCHALTFVAE